MLCCEQVRLFVRGAETVLSDAANPEELFATGEFETRWCAGHSLLRSVCSAARCTCILQPEGDIFLLCNCWSLPINRLRQAVPCRELSSVVDKVNAERLKREFKSFKAFMKQLVEEKPLGESSTR